MEAAEKKRKKKTSKKKKNSTSSLHFSSLLFSSLFSLTFTLFTSLQGAPGDPRFKQLLRESDALIQSLGGRLSPSQSLPSALERGGGE